MRQRHRTAVRRAILTCRDPSVDEIVAYLPVGRRLDNARVDAYRLERG
jgi:hypothetical protein